MLIFTIVFLLLLMAVTYRRDISIYFSRVSLIILNYCSVIALNSSYLISIEKGIGLFGGLLHSTCNTQLFQIFIIFLTTVILQLTGFYPRKVWTKQYTSVYKQIISKFFNYTSKIINKMGEQYKILEYPLIILFILIGGIFLLSSSDLVTMFLCIELQSYGLYILTTIYRNSELATLAGLTYFLLGSLSSCFIFLSIGLIYANSGTTNLDGIYVLSNIDIAHYLNIDKIYLTYTYYIYYCLLIMSVGFLFKVSAAPFHFWSPDVYDAIPTIVTTFVAIVSKISLFIFLLELVHYTENAYTTRHITWTISLLVSCLLSLIIGTIVGLSQYRIKRLFAYSTISHVGFILLALSINSIESIQAFIFYILQYTICNLNGFVLLISIGYSLYNYINKNKQYNILYDKNNSPIQLISQIKGYFYLNPVVAISLAITIFSFVGLPPLIGFFAKQMVLSAALDSGYVFLTLIAILTSVISAAYYLGLIKQVFFDKLEYIVDDKIKNLFFLGYILKKNQIEYIIYQYNNIVLSNSLTFTISNLTLIILLFILSPIEWLSIANILAVILFNP